MQAVGAEGSTALHEAIGRGNQREALLLLSAGANPFCENNCGALHRRKATATMVFAAVCWLRHPVQWTELLLQKAARSL